MFATLLGIVVLVPIVPSRTIDSRGTEDPSAVVLESADPALTHVPAEQRDGPAQTVPLQHGSFACPHAAGPSWLVLETSFRPVDASVCPVDASGDPPVSPASEHADTSPAAIKYQPTLVCTAIVFEPWSPAVRNDF